MRQPTGERKKRHEVWKRLHLHTCVWDVGGVLIHV